MNTYAIPPLVTSILILAYGIFVLRQNIKSSVNITFSLMTFATFLWLFCISMTYLSPDEKLALFWDKNAYLGVIFIPVTIYHFTVTFLGLKNQKKFILMSYIIVIIFLFLSRTNYFISGVRHYFFGYYTKAGLIHPLFLIFFMAMILISIYNLYKEYKKAEIGSLRHVRIKYMFFGILIASFGAIDFLADYGVEFYPFGFTFVIAFIFISGYAIVKYRLLDIETFTYRTLGYMAISFLILASYTGVFTLIHRMFHKKFENPILTGGLLLVFLFIFMGIKNKIWKLIDRVFYRDKYKYRETLNAFSKSLNVLMDLEELLTMIVNIIADTVRINKASIMILDDGKQEYFVKNQKGISSPEVRLSKDDPFVTWLFSQGGVVEKEMLGMDPWYSKMKEVGLQRFRELESEICIPLIVGNQMVGLLNLGKKISGEIYKKDDIELLSSLGAQSAIAIHNAITYHSLEKRTEQLLTMCKIGQDVGSSLELDTVAKTLLNNIKSTMRAEIVSILLLDEETERLVIKASCGLDEEVAKNTSLKIGEKISGWVAQHAQPALVNDIESDPRFAKRSHEKYYTRSLVSVPLMLKGKVIGVVNVNNKETKRAFTFYDLEMLMGICGEASVIVENARLYTALRQSYLRTIQSLAEALDAKDRYTRGHVSRVCDYAIKIATELNLSQSEIENISTAAMLHDIGKIGIKETILLKPGKLTDSEYNEIKKHPETSVKIIKPIGLSEEILSIIRHHHEWYNGKGYPKGLIDEKIPIGARILSVADAFDAMVSERPYRKAFTKEGAMEELRKCNSSQFDPEIVETFLKIV